MKPASPGEVPLEGAVGAIRVGSTVRKQSGPWTPTVHALLRFLRDAGWGEEGLEPWAFLREGALDLINEDEAWLRENDLMILDEGGR